ncbi:MAG TPA: ETC complex I subunit [Candidatus Limnocylindria bacterium]|nr:ETC complex I subunit [Candidatus Limnocylindria bacterium]
MTSVTIYRPSKTAMQSGLRNTQRWVLEFDAGSEKFVEPLMGWTGSADTTSQLRLRFNSRDAAVAFAERHGLKYTIQEPKVRRIRPKSYAENFAYDRVE